MRFIVAALALGFLAGCGSKATLPVSAGIGPDPVLPEPPATLIPTINAADAEPWPDDEQPVALEGAVLTAFARGLDHPRWLHVLPNGDVLVAESNAPERPEAGQGIRGWMMSRVMEKAGAAVPSADRITLLRDTSGNGVADQRHAFLTDLHSPFGMVLLNGSLYVANTDGVVRFPYREGQTRIDAPGEHVVDLPAGPINYHWTKNIVPSPDGTRLYAAIGSNSNIAERGITAERGRAAIWEIDIASGRHREFATGLRNPVGMAWVPETGELWTVVNERDELGGDLVPDYMTVVQENGFYGWPYSYFGQHVDERVEPGNPELVEQAIVPDYALGAHTASLGLAYARESSLPLGSGMFVGQHGSWNRDPRSGYKVIFVPFDEGLPAGDPVDVLTGFLTEDGKARGRPVGVALARDGALLVADDVGNAVWRVSGP
jgi:glucose/arabinose dehydrogenase